MSGSEQRSPAGAGHVQLDSRPILPTTDGNENITEVDAFNISRQSLDPAVEYKMNHQRRGVALIFNHERFNWRLRLKERRGTMEDGNNLKRSLTDLGFEVRLFDDLNAEDVWRKIYEASMDDHSNADCFVCVFLSHGVDDHIYAFDDKIKIQTITDMFRGDKCQSLVGKPKIFIIQEDENWEVPQEVSGPASCSKQSHGVKPGHAGLYAIFIQITISKLIYEPGFQQIACRGDKHDDAVIAHDATDSSSESLVNKTEVDAAGVYTLPAGADFIMCYSVAQGYYSHRDTVFGSWYIQDLCETLRKHGSSLEFTELLTVVNRKVSYRKVHVYNNTNVEEKKQIPCFTSMLTKKLYFHPKSK